MVMFEEKMSKKPKLYKSAVSKFNKKKKKRLFDSSQTICNDDEWRFPTYFTVYVDNSISIITIWLISSAY